VLSFEDNWVAFRVDFFIYASLDTALKLLHLTGTA
jgi:hypothetical protein